MQQEMSLPGGVAGRHGPPSLLSPARHSPPGNGDARTSETVGVNREVTRKSTLRKHPSASPRRDHRISGSAASEGCLSPGTSRPAAWPSLWLRRAWPRLVDEDPPLRDCFPDSGLFPSWFLIPSVRQQMPRSEQWELRRGLCPFWSWE